MKGKQEKVSADEELAAMYEKHKKRKRILLWLKCKSKVITRKRASAQSDSTDIPLSKRQSSAHASLVNTMTEVDGLVDRLKQKHGEQYPYS